MDNCRTLNKSPHTLKNYYADLKKFINWYEANYGRKVSQANGQTITLYKDFLSGGGGYTPYQKKRHKIRLFLKHIFKKDKPAPLAQVLQAPLAVASRRRHLSAIRNFFEYLKQVHEDRSKIFAINPVKPKIHGIKLKDIDITPTKMLRPGDWYKLDQGLFRAKERLIVYLLYWGGLRLEELTTLKVEYFHRESGSLKFPRKGGSIHTLMIQNSAEVFKYLDYWLNQRPIDSEHLFARRFGRPESTRNMYNLIKRILKKCDCDMELTPHSFRKACATELYLKKRDLLLVRDYLNHSDAKVTQTYIDKRTLQENSVAQLQE